MTALDIELALTNQYGPFYCRRNLVIPNISWGMNFRHELDLLVISPAGYATEVEIKVSLNDLRRDAIKKHGHKSERIKYLFFAMPAFLAENQKAQSFVPAHAGIILVRENGKCGCIREAQTQDTRPWSQEEMAKLYRLGALRIWSLKKRLKREEAWGNKMKDAAFQADAGRREAVNQKWAIQALVDIEKQKKEKALEYLKRIRQQYSFALYEEVVEYLKKEGL